MSGIQLKINLFVACILLPVLSLIAQFNQLKGVEAEEMNIVFMQDFETSTTGPYIYEEWQRDWNYPSWDNGVRETCSIVDRDGDKAFRSYMPEGEWGLLNYPGDTIGGGFQFWPPLPGNHTELYMSYNIMFRPGVDFVISGKLPGILGGPQDMDPGRAPNYDEGFTSFLAFHGYDPRGLCAFYLYHHDQTGEYGDLLVWPDPYNPDESRYVFKVDNVNERWINLTIRIVLNSLNESGGNYDGILEGFSDGKLIYQRTGLRLRNLSSITIDHMMMAWFYGGNTEDFAAAQEEWILIDDVVVFNYLPGSDVPMGNTPSPEGRVLNLPWIKGADEVVEDIDEEPPTIPSNLQVTGTSPNSLSISWDPSTDNTAVTGYRVYMDNQLETALTKRTYTKEGLAPESSHFFSVTAYDAAGNESEDSDIVIGVTDQADIEDPSAPGNLRVVRYTGYSIEIAWDPASDNVGIDRYGISLDGSLRFSTVDQFFIISGLTPNTSYSISVRAYDTSNNPGPFSNTVTQSTAAPDSQPPSSPVGLEATEVLETTISLSWEPSNDNVGVNEYKIYVNNVEWETSTRTDETISRLQPGLDYAISVSAADEAGNESPKSSSIVVTTKNSDVTTQPTLPTISIIQVQDKTIRPNCVSEMAQLGFAELKNFGLEISEPRDPGKETLILQGIESTQVVNMSRVTQGLQVLYNFSEGDGDVVKDISGNDPPLNLNISRAGLATEWLAGQGLRILDNTTISYQGSSARLDDAVSATNEITLEAWIKQEEIEQTGPARIITLSRDNSNRAFTLAHDGNKAFYNYVARLHTSETDGNGLPELKTSTDFTSRSLHHVVYVKNNLGNETIYINGVELASDFRAGNFSSWESDYQFTLANETTGERPWKGVLYLAAVYNRALTREELMQNYTSGFGQIRFTTKLDTLQSNVAYSLIPFISTDQGLVYGEAEDFIYKNVAKTDSLFAVYPNPNNGKMTITIRNRDESIKSCHLRLADFSGKVHFTEEIDLSEGLLENIFELQLPYTLSNGFYSLILIAGARSIAEKIVIMR